MARDWSRHEVSTTVQDYLDMLAEELAGRPFSKAGRRRLLAQQLDDRSEAAIEFKHANISAWMVENGLPYVEGYRPRFNYQNLIGEVARELLGYRPRMQELFESAAMTVPAARQAELEVVGRPTPLARDGATVRRVVASGLPDYVALQEANTLLGTRGEETVLEYEKKWLHDAGRCDLARQVRWIAQEQGPVAGYDILSFDTAGAPKHLEVKTTNYGMYTPFFLSAPELEHSHKFSDRYELRRIFGFGTRPKMFKLLPPLDAHCRLEPSVYRATWGA